METTFSITNTNKRVAHIWLVSQLGMPGTARQAESPASSQLYEFNLPEVEMPKYTKYTLQVKQFQMLPNHPYDPAAGAYGLEPVAAAQPLMVNAGGTTVPPGAIIQSKGAFIQFEGDPFELNYVPNQNHTGAAPVNPPNPFGRGVERLGRTVMPFDTTASGSGLCSTERPTNPKIVCNNSILGHNAIRVDIVDQLYFELVIGDVARAAVPGPPAIPAHGIRPLPPWGMCIEIEGIDGFEEFDMPMARPEPLPTGGINTMFQSGFHDSNKYGGGGNGQIGY
tara:strand:+ start:1138 stop:1977 length:840 start_codon:yes stop_codon:yes gene_type:complete